MALSSTPFYLALLLRSFDVGCECKIYLSVYGKYTNNCGIPPIQNTHITCAEVARWTVLVSCSTDLDYCVVIVDRVSVLLGHMHRTLKSFWTVYAKLPCCFSLFCLPFGSRSKHHNHCNIHLRSESITGNFEIRRHHKTFRQFLDSCSCIKSESVCKYYSHVAYYTRMMFTKSVCVLRTGFRIHLHLQIFISNGLGLALPYYSIRVVTLPCTTWFDWPCSITFISKHDSLQCIIQITNGLLINLACHSPII